MKRSEMVQIVAEFLATRLPEYDVSDKTTSDLLAVIVDAGMLPPETDRTKCSDLDIDLPIETNGEYMPDRFQCGWDDE